MSKTPKAPPGAPSTAPSPPASTSNTATTTTSSLGNSLGGSSSRALRRLSSSTNANATNSSSTGGGGGANASTSNARHAAAAAKYWRALCDTIAFHAPCGRPIVEIEEGTIVEEGMRYVDPFDDMWIAVQSEDEDGGVVWIRRYASGALTDAKDAEWEPVIEAPKKSTSAAPSTPPVLEADISPLDVTANVMDHALSLATPHAALMEHYWSATTTNGARLESDRNWNHDFQTAIEDILYKFTPASHNSRKRLAEVVTDFADAVEDSCAKIVQEMFHATAQRTIKRHPTALDTYYDNGIMFRVCVDTSGGLYGGDRNAAKVAAQLHRATQQLLCVAPLRMISVPLVVMMSIGGYRILASTIAPIRRDRLLVGEQQGGQQGRCNGTQQFPIKAMSSLGARLGLKEHTYKNGTKGFFPTDAQLFAGLDHRMYLINMGRLCPPPAPSTRCPTYHPLTTPLCNRIRPEVLEKCGRALNPDAFVPGCSTPEDNSEIATITQWMRDEGIPTVAAILGMHEAVDHPSQEDVSCCSCKREISNELRFGLCRHVSQCCVICSQCYLDLLKLDVLDGNRAEADKQLAAIPLGCSGTGGGEGDAAPTTADGSTSTAAAGGEAAWRSPLRRELHGLVLQPSITSVFHANCVNLRHLSMVYNRLPQSALMCTGKYLEIEMIARAAKQLLSQKLLLAQDAAATRELCAKFFVGLLQPTGEAAEALWSNELGPVIQSQFDIFSPFDTTALDISLVYERVSELTGVELTDASLASLGTDQAFVQLSRIHPVMKSIQIPELVEEVGEYQNVIKGTLEEVLLFWIGIDEQEDPAWAPLFPEFMQSRF